MAIPAGPSDRDTAAAESIFQHAVALRKQGQLAEAEASCSEALAIDPRLFAAYHLQGLIALERGEIERGVGLIEISLTINPNQAIAHSNIGNALLSSGHPERALECFDRALRLNPGSLIAHYNRGNALRELRRHEPALASYDAALALDDRHPLVLNNRGLVLADLGRKIAALDSFERALAVAPRSAAVQRNRAAVLLSMDRPHEALEALEQLQPWAPDDSLTPCAHGNALLALKRPEAAFDSYSQALRINPTLIEALINRGAASHQMRRAVAALTDYVRAIEIDPSSVSALHNAGTALLDLGRAEEAAESFAAVLRIAPAHSSALENLFHLRMAACVWDDHESWSERLHDSLRQTKRFVNPLSLLMFDDAELSMACACAFAADRYPQQDSLGPCVPVEPSDASRKIRVAYVSADFRDHPVSHLLVGALEGHDRQRFEVVGVYLAAGGAGEFDLRVRSAFDTCIDVSGRSDCEVAQLLRDRGVDIAVDLMGFTEKLRLGVFAYRAAPVQISFLGYAGTLGAPYMDYLLADEVVIPHDREGWYRERVIRLPHCYLPTDDRRTLGVTPTRAQVGLPDQGLVFCAFTKAHKINPPMFDIWMRLLHEAKGSVLWLRDMGVQANNNLRDEAASRGLDANRLVFAPHLGSMAEHLGRQALADLCLDTLPYNAHSTTCDALWAGVPVLTATGNSFQSRVAASALTAVGLPELITDGLDGYLACAMELARDPAKLRALRSRLNQQRNRTALFDTSSYTRHLEAAFIVSHENAQLGAAPRSFSVPSSRG